MSDDFEVLESSFDYWSGLNRLKVMRVGAPVDVDIVIEKVVPQHCRDWVLDSGEYSEGKTITRHYIDIYYPYRDLINVQPHEWDGKFESLVPGCFWRRTDKSRISQLIQNAADLYWGTFDCPPLLAVLPVSVKAPIEMVLSGCCDGQKISIRNATWMPKACVIVTGSEVRS
jgi:hypothetical protein